MIKRFGPGASMIRPIWNPREKGMSKFEKEWPAALPNLGACIENKDLDIEALTEGMKTASLEFVPAILKRKQKTKGTLL
jgi:hypothetical protein